MSWSVPSHVYRCTQRATVCAQRSVLRVNYIFEGEGCGAFGISEFNHMKGTRWREKGATVTTFPKEADLLVVQKRKDGSVRHNVPYHKA